MPTYSFARKVDGMFTGRQFTGPREMLELNTPSDCHAITGRCDELSQRVDLDTLTVKQEIDPRTGELVDVIDAQVIDYQPPAPADTVDTRHEWDESSKRWIGKPTERGLKRRLEVHANVRREQQLDAGVEFNGYRFDSDERSRSNLTAVLVAVNAGVPLPKDFTWRDAGNVDRPMTAADLVAFAGVMLAHGWEAYRTNWNEKGEIEAAPSIEIAEQVGKARRDTP